jgi:hypothetical protein
MSSTMLSCNLFLNEFILWIYFDSKPAMLIVCNLQVFSLFQSNCLQFASVLFPCICKISFFLRVRATCELQVERIDEAMHHVSFLISVWQRRCLENCLWEFIGCLFLGVTNSI